MKNCRYDFPATYDTDSDAPTTILADINSWEAETGMILFVPSMTHRSSVYSNSGDAILLQAI
jgi:hypothetical protein